MLAPENVRQAWIDPLAWRRCVIVIFSAHQQARTLGIGKGNAVLGETIPIGILAGDSAQKLLIYQLPL